MPFVFWLDIAAFSMVTALIAALTVLVMSSGPRRTLNQLFACFTLRATAWGLFSLLCRQALWLEPGRRPGRAGPGGGLLQKIFTPAALLRKVRAVPDHRKEG